MLALLSLTAFGQDCNGLMSERLATFHGTDCSTPTVWCDNDGDGVQNNRCTPDEFLELIYDDPLGQLVQGGYLPALAATNLPGEMFAIPVPKCVDGTDDCDPGAQLRCVDGTRPLFWVDPPTVSIPAGEARWIFTFQGGGACGRVTATDKVDGWNGYVEGDAMPSGDSCKWAYTDGGKRDHMTDWEIDENATGSPKIGPILVLDEAGILDPDRADYDTAYRVRISKCSMDRGNGQTYLTDYDGTNCPAGHDCSFQKVDPDTGGFPTSQGDTFPLQFSGRLQAEAVLNLLRDGGVEVRDWSRLDNAVIATLPPLEDAGQVVFAGHSGGAAGLQQNLDHLAGIVQSYDPDIDVRGLFDARGWPSLAHTEAQHHGTSMYDENAGSLFPHGGIAHLPVSSESPGALRQTSRAAFFGGDDMIRDALWEVEHDSSCWSTLVPGERWRCREGSHVMFNHTSTPFFLRQALEDRKHVGIRDVPYATDPSYRWGENYRARVVDQAQQFMSERNGPGPREAVYGWTVGTEVGVGLFLPDSDQHEGFFTGEFDTTAPPCRGLIQKSYADAFWDWLTVPGDSIHVDDPAFQCPVTFPGFP